MAGKLGKKPATINHKDLLFTEFVKPKVTLAVAPVGFGHEKLVPSWGMLGNDSVGDCVLAGGCHETMLWNAIGKKTVSFTDQNTLSDYSAITGYDPADPSTDNGTDMRNAMDYRRHTGLIDANGVRHLIGGYVALEPGNWHQLLEALEIFDAVAIGILVPDYAMQQFDAGQPWAVRPGGTIEGGHYVPVVGRPHISMLDVVTWARTQQMTKAFYRKFNDESFAVLSEESMIAGKTAEGYDLAQLEAAIAGI